MNKSFLLLAGILLSFAACQSTATLPKYKDQLKKEALDAGLTIIKTYFDKDCAANYVLYADTFYIMDGDGIIAKKDVKERHCKNLDKVIRGNGGTYEKYLEIYKIEILTGEELLAKFKKATFPDYYKPDPTDLFYMGWELKEGIDESQNFIWDDAFWFLLRKVDGKWLQKGVSG